MSEPNAVEIWGTECVKSDKVIYLERHIDNFNPSVKEQTFIDEKLTFQDGKMKLEGILLFVAAMTVLAAVMSSLITISMILNPDEAFHLPTALLTIIAFVTVYAIFNRKRYAKYLLIATSIIGIAFMFITAFQTQRRLDYIVILARLLWMAYYLISVRIKYTLVE